MQEKGLIAICGEIRSGKTTLALKIINKAVAEDVKVAVFNIDKKLLQENIQAKLVNQTRLKIESIEKICRKLKQRTRLDLVIIDDIDTIFSDNIECVGRGKEIAQIIKCLKQLAEELQAVIIFTAVSKITKEEFEIEPIKALETIVGANLSTEIQQYVDKIILLNGIERYIVADKEGGIKSENWI